MNALSELI